MASCTNCLKTWNNARSDDDVMIVRKSFKQGEDMNIRCYLNLRGGNKHLRGGNTSPV